MFTVELFKIAKTWKQPNRPQQRNGYKDVVQIDNGILLSH